MSATTPARSSISSLVASRRRRRGEAIVPIGVDRRSDGLRARFARTGPTTLEGHVFDAADPDCRFVVELVLDDHPAGIQRAELFDPALRSDCGDGCYGFAFHLDAAMLPAVRSAHVRIANTEQRIGDAIDLRSDDGFEAPAAPQGSVEWTGGLRLAGWIARGAAPFPALIEASANGARVASTRASLWRSVARGDGRTAEPGFVIDLPFDLADGRAKTIEVSCDGKPLFGSPVRLIAFADGLRARLLERAETEAEAERGRLFDHAFPQSVPFASLAEWERRFPLPAPASVPAGSIAVAVVGTDGGEATLTSEALDALDWVGTMLPCSIEPHRFAPEDLLAFLRAEPDCGAVLFVAAGTRLHSGMPERLRAALDADPAAVAAYCDVVVENEDGTRMPLALPAFDYERALEQAIGSHCFLLRRGAAIAAAERGIGDLHRLFLGSLETSGLAGGSHLHVPGFGASVPLPLPEAGAVARSAREHLAARGREAEVRPRAGGTLPAARVLRRPASRSLAVILDAGHDPHRVRPALDALAETRGRRNLAITVSGSELGEDLQRDLGLAGVAFIEASGHASNARRLASAIESAEAELVCVVDARLRPHAPDWLEELLGRFAEDGVGIAAPTVLDSAGLVAGGGVLLDPGGRPLPPFADRRHGDPGYGDALRVARQAAAVGSACFLTRRADFLALGGFDPTLFPAYHGSIDYCLKLQALGRRVVVTPDAVLAFDAGSDAGAAELPAAKAALRREERALLSRWLAVFANDPFASPLLGRGLPAFSGLAWPPGDRSPRHPTIPPARAVPPGW